MCKNPIGDQGKIPKVLKIKYIRPGTYGCSILCLPIKKLTNTLIQGNTRALLYLYGSQYLLFTGKIGTLLGSKLNTIYNSVRKEEIYTLQGC